MQKKWDKTADIIIIGAGTAGLYAAIEARKAGESVLILEKMRDAEWRSSMPVIAGVIDFAGTKYQEERGIKDAPAKYAEDGVNYCGGLPELWKAMTDEHLKVLTLFEKELNLIPRGVIGGWGHSVARSHTFDGPQVLKKLEDRALELGAVILWEHNAEQLVTDPEKGVKTDEVDARSPRCERRLEVGLLLHMPQPAGYVQIRFRDTNLYPVPDSRLLQHIVL